MWPSHGCGTYTRTQRCCGNTSVASSRLRALAGLLDVVSGFGRRNIFLRRFGTANGAGMLRFGDGFVGEQLAGSFGVRARQGERSRQRFPIVLGGLDLLLARSRLQFRELR